MCGPEGRVRPSQAGGGYRRTCLSLLTSICPAVARVALGWGMSSWPVDIGKQYQMDFRCGKGLWRRKLLLQLVGCTFSASRLWLGELAAGSTGGMGLSP